jgi:arginase
MRQSPLSSSEASLLYDDPSFDLVLGFGQWQGSGRSDDLPRGARAAAKVCSRFGPLEQVPLSITDETVHGVNRWSALYENFCSARDMLQRRYPRRLLTAGGDCAVDVAPIDYLQGRYPDLTVIWVDAHLDANTPETSPSGNFHGMPVSAILGLAPEPMRRLMGTPVAADRFFYHGIRVGDEGEWVFQRRYGLRVLDPDALPSGPVHVHFDLDALDPEEFPHLAYREPDGLGIQDSITLIERIARHGDLVGMTITEFAPANDEGASQGADVIRRLCEAALGWRPSI